MGIDQQAAKRIQIFYYFLVMLVVVFVFRLFYLQVLRHDYYAQTALDSQLRQFEIPAERGSIYAYDGSEIVPLVLNETRYRVVADPQIINDIDRTAIELSSVINVPADKIKQKLETNSRYEILANKQTKETKSAVEDLSLPGIFTTEKVPLRVYVRGDIAPQVLGFVNDAGTGNYGVEQFMNSDLAGVSGRVKALTDQNNVPLLATGDNISIDAVDGQDIVLTMDVSMQKQAEAILKTGLEHAISESGSVIIMEAETGAVKAMATYPTFDPAKFSEIEDPAVFTNTAVSTPLEPGSIMKVLTAAAAIDSGSVTPTQTYSDPGFFRADGATITNVGRGGSASTSVSDILQYSLNTGATWLLMQMGGGELNEQGRKVWHDYLANRYQFGKPTGIEQGFGSEAAGVVPDPLEGFGLSIKYANTAFGQGITVTPIQMVAAVASIVNGGDYYKPTLVSGTLGADGSVTPKQPEIVKSGIVAGPVSQNIRSFMENVVVTNNRSAKRDGYRVGGKTGTAEIANPDGGYFEDKFNGTYVGFVGGDSPEYVIMVRVDEPKIPGYAGSQAAAPIFSSLSNMLIDNFAVPRISQ